MIIAVLLLAASAPPQKVAAVLELRNKLEGADRNLIDAAFLTDVVRQQALEDVPSLKLMTRENVISLLEASGKKLEECEGECEVDTGRRLGADVVVSGEVLRFGRGYRANLRLHDTHSAQLLSAAVASGETPEALEKDLVRAVSKLMQPLAGPQPQRARSAEWYETIGIFLIGGVGPLGVENDTPRTLAAPVNSLTLSKFGNEALNLGLGVQYHPVRWLSIDAMYLLQAFDSDADFATGDGRTGGPKLFAASAIALGATGLWRLTSWARAFAGVGVELFLVRIAPENQQLDATDFVHYSATGGGGAGSTYSQKETFALPYLRAGFELKPQERFGIQLFALVYPPHELDVYINDVQNPQGTDQPVAKYTLPVITANAALVLYF